MESNPFRDAKIYGTKKERFQGDDFQRSFYRFAFNDVVDFFEYMQEFLQSHNVEMKREPLTRMEFRGVSWGSIFAQCPLSSSEFVDNRWRIKWDYSKDSILIWMDPNYMEWVIEGVEKETRIHAIELKELFAQVLKEVYLALSKDKIENCVKLLEG